MYLPLPPPPPPRGGGGTVKGITLYFQFVTHEGSKINLKQPPPPPPMGGRGGRATHHDTGDSQKRARTQVFDHHMALPTKTFVRQKFFSLRLISLEEPGHNIPYPSDMPKLCTPTAPPRVGGGWLVGDPGTQTSSNQYKMHHPPRQYLASIRSSHPIG